MDQFATTKPAPSGAVDATDALRAAQRGMAAFGTAHELTVKALMRAATRQAELARETMSDCMNVAASACLPHDGKDGHASLQHAGLTAESWVRTWYSISEDLSHELMEAAEVMFASAAPAPSPTRTNGKATTSR